MKEINQNEPSASQWATKQMLAKRYSVCLRTITHWMNMGLLVFFKVGRVVRFDVAACDALLKEHGLA